MNRTARLVLAALVLIPAFAATPAQAARKMEVALQDDKLFLYGAHPFGQDAAYLKARAMNVSRIRMNILWFQTMPEAQYNSRTKPGTINYNFEVSRAAVAKARSYGIKVHLNITGDPPRWACGNKKPPGKCKGNKPNAKEFGKFAQVVAKTFGRSIDRYSVWNEPNWYTWLSPHNQAPLLYRKLYQEGYKGLKKGNRRAQVLMGETAPYFQKAKAQPPLDFLRDMFCVNKRFKKVSSKCTGAVTLDGYAHHPYDFQVAPTQRRRGPGGRDNVTMANLGDLTKTLDQLRKKGFVKGPKAIPLYLTEHGYFARTSRRISEAKRAKYTVKAFDMAQKNPRVKSQLYYVFASPPAGDPSAFFDLGILRVDGSETRPYRALKNWAASAARSGRVAKPGRCSAC